MRLVVPLVVIDELDRKKYAGAGKMGGRAASALRALYDLLGRATPGTAAELPDRAGVSVEVLLDEDGHTGVAHADQEIIQRSVLLALITGTPVTLVTADTGMRLRAQAVQLQPLLLPAKFGKNQAADPSD